MACSSRWLPFASHVVGLVDLLAHKQSLHVLLGMGQLDQPVNMREFTAFSTHSPPRAKVLREQMEAAGLVAVKRVRRQGTAELIEISLTGLGRNIADHLVAVDDILRAEEKRREREHRRR